MRIRAEKNKTKATTKILGLKPGWLLYYISGIYHLNRFRARFDDVTEKLISIPKNEPAVGRAKIFGQRLGPWEKGDKNPPWGRGCVTIGISLLLMNPFCFSRGKTAKQ